MLSQLLLRLSLKPTQLTSMVPTTDTLTHIMVTVPTMVPITDSMPILPMGMEVPEVATPM